ncbi:MAG: ABC transporter substrate-binding protein [Syntrophomonadales bacterium]|jgi:ABC-type nitrate/sulfonate/bicarbonate transport system substrate-binding protein
MKRIWLLMVCLLVLGLVTGCGGGGQTEKDAPEKVTVLLDWTPNTNHTGVYVADKLGYYQEEGLEVDIVQPSAGGALQLVAAGQGDFGFSYQEEMTIARTQGLPVKALAAVIQHNTSGFAAPTDRGIKTPGDFEGKKYGGWGSPAEEAMIRALMNQVGADFSKVEMVNIGSADFFSSVERNVDFAWIFWGWAGIESELKEVPLDFIRLIDYSPALDFYSPVLAANEKTIAEDPDKVSRFMRATAKGYEYCIEHPQEAAEILLEAVPELNRDLVMASQEYLVAEYQADAPRWGLMAEKRWRDYADWMYSQGLIEKPLESEKAFTNEFIPESD